MTDLISFGRLQIDWGASEVACTETGRSERLAAGELAILRTLLAQPHQAVTMADLRAAASAMTGKSVTKPACGNYLGNLRQKLNRIDPVYKGEYLKTRPGQSYMLVDPDDPDALAAAVSPFERMDNAILACFIEAGDRHISRGLIEANVTANGYAVVPQSLDFRLLRLPARIDDPNRGRRLLRTPDGSYVLNLPADEEPGRSAIPFVKHPGLAYYGRRAPR